MSAKAEAEAAAALRELGATMKASTNAPKLHTESLCTQSVRGFATLLVTP